MKKLFIFLFAFFFIKTAGAVPALQNYLSEYGYELQTGEYVNTADINTGTDIVVQNISEVRIQNSGTITNFFNVAAGGKLIQVIKSNADAKQLNITGDGNFSLLVGGTSNTVSLSKVVDVAGKANVINVKNMTHLLVDSKFDSGDLHNKLIRLEAGDPVWIDVADDFNNFDSPIFYSWNLNNNKFEIASNGNDSLFYFKLSERNSALYIDKYRATNYSNILNNKMGEFLDDIRRNNPNDELLIRLDSALTKNELNNILSGAVRLNPINLMDSVRVVNMFNLNDRYDVMNDLNAMVKPVFLFGNGFQSIGAQMYLSSQVMDNLYITLSGYGHKISYDKDIDDYDAMMFGGDIRIDYVGDNIFVRGIAGANIDKFQIQSVFDGNSGVDNPFGHSFYAYADGGYKFVVSDNFDVRLFAGAGMDSLNILNAGSSKFFGRIGSDASYLIKTGDVIYSYNGRISVNTFGYLDANVGVKVWLNSDDAGGGISVGVSDSDIGWIGKITADVRLMF